MAAGTNSLGTISVTLTALTAEFSRSLKGAQKQLKAVGADMQQTGVLAAGLSASIIALGAVAVSAGSKFESSMVRTKAVAQATDYEFKKLEQAAKFLGETTEHSAKAVADGMGFMAMAGFNARQIIETIPSVLQLATAGAMDLAQAADITTNILTGMGLAVSDLADVNDVLVNTVVSSNVNVAMLGEAFKYIGPVAKSAGVEFQEVAAALGALGNAGIQGSMAGTTLRGAISKLLKPTGEAAAIIKRLGIRTKDSKGKFVGLIATVKQLEKSGADTADMLTIFGLRAGPGMQALVSQGSEALERLQAKLGRKGIAQAIQQAQLGTFEGQMKLLSSAAEGLAISFGQILMPMVRELVSGLRFIITWFQSLSSETKTYIIYAGIAAATIGALIAGLAALVAVAGPLIIAFKLIAAAFLVLFSPLVTIPLAIVTAIIAAWGYLYTYWDGTYQAMLDTVIGWADSVRGIAKGVADAFFAAWEWVADAVSDLVVGLFDILMVTGKYALYAMAIAASPFIAVLGIIGLAIWTIVKIFQAVAPLVVGYFSSWADAGRALGKDILVVLTAAWDEIGSMVSVAITDIGKMFSGWAKSVSKWAQGLKKIFLDVFNWMGKQWDKVTSKISSTAIDAYGMITGLSPDDTYALKQSLGSAWDDLDIGDEISGIFEAGKATWEGLDIGGAIKDGFDSGKSAIVKGADKLLLSLKRGGELAYDAISDAIPDSLKNIAKVSGMPDVSDLAKGTIPVAKGTAPGSGGAGGGAGVKDDLGMGAATQAHKNYWAGVDAMKNQAQSIANGFLSRAGDAGNAIMNVVGGFQKGGLFGGIAQIVIEIVTRTEAFKKILEVVGKIFTTIIEWFAPIVEMFVPIFEALAMVFTLLTPIVEVFLLVLKPFGLLLKVVATVIGGIVWAIGKLWNGLIEAIASVVSIFSDDAAARVRSKKVDTDSIEEGLSEIWNPVEDDAEALGSAIDDVIPPVDALGDAATKATESMTNIPSGFKIARNRYLAEQGPGDNPFLGRSGTPGSASEAAQANIAIENIIITTTARDGQDIADETLAALDGEAYVQTGSTLFRQSTTPGVA